MTLLCEYVKDTAYYKIAAFQMISNLVEPKNFYTDEPIDVTLYIDGTHDFVFPDEVIYPKRRRKIS